uniref:Connector enhancer of kinase suppressor of Ras 1 n=1 Tax=Pavo cristatus TaxID=9049 RepID=A0A8C9F5U8_PAVCR
SPAAMEPVGAWGPTQTAAWLRGLDAAVQGYPFEEWGLAGTELLRLSEGALEVLGVWRVGHQELLLEAVEQLRALVSNGLGSTSLRTLTERLRELAQHIETVVLEGSPGGATPLPPPITLLACVVDLIGAAKRLFSWLNRYLFSTLNDFSSTRDIVLLCARLVEVLQTVGGCTHITGICESIVGCSPPALLDRRAMLQLVGLALPLAPCDSPPDSPSTPTLPPELWGSPPASPSTPVLPPESPRSPPASPSTPMLPYNPLVRYPLPRCPSPSLIPPHSHLLHCPAGSGDHFHQLLPALCVHDQLGGELGPVPFLSVTVPWCHLVPPFTLGLWGHCSLSGWVLGAS